MISAPPLDFRHSPGWFRQLPHAAVAFIRGIGGHSRCCLLRRAQGAVLVDGLGARRRGHDEMGARA